jgi:DNA polymerase IV
MDAFFASVEQRDFPHLRGKPLVVGGNRQNRGVVAAASYEARRFGVHSAMSMGEALRLCPHLHRQPHRMDVYQDVSARIREIFLRYTSKVEPLSIDEAFLDLSDTSVGRGMTATKLAFQLKQEIWEETKLTASAGVAPNKFLAKIASDLNKPNGLTVVQPHQVLEFLGPLSIKKVWGIGPATAKRFHRMGIDTIGELRGLDLEELVAEFGRSGFHYFRLARGIDERSVESRGPAKSLSTESTFSQDVRDPLELRRHIERQSAELARRLDRAGLLAATVILKIRYSDFETVTRSRTATPAHRQRDLIETAALDLLERTEYRSRAIRLLGVGCSGLLEDDGPVQLSLFSQEELS